MPFNQYLQNKLRDKTIRNLDLNDSMAYSSGDLLSYLNEGFGEFQSLETLYLSRNVIGCYPDKIKNLQLSSLKSLETLGLGYNYLGVMGKDINCLQLGKLKQLNTLFLHNNGLGKLGKNINGLKLGGLNRLQFLDLDKNVLGLLNEEIKYLHLEKLQELRELLMYSNDLGSLGENFKYMKLGKLKSLETLNISKNNLNALAEYFPDFVNDLANMHALTSLDISDNNLSPKQLQLIYNMIQQSFSLTKVKGIAFENGLFDPVAPQVLEILKRNRDLTITWKLDGITDLIRHIKALQAEPTSNTINKEFQYFTHKLAIATEVLENLLQKLSSYEEPEARFQEIRVGDVLLDCIDVYKNIVKNPEMVNNLELIIPDSHPKFEDIRCKKFADETFGALDTNKNVRKSFIKALPYNIKKDGSFIQNNLDLQFDATLATLVRREAEFDRQEAWQLDNDGRSYYLQFVLLKALAEQISKQSPPQAYSPRLKLSNKENVTSHNTQMELNDLPEIISFETKAKPHIEKLFNAASNWVNSEECNVSNKDNWIKLMSAVYKLQDTARLELT